MNQEAAPRTRPPVTDWATDWDHLDPQWRDNPFPIWDDLRGKCPIAHTERYLGAYLPTSYAAVKAIAYDTKNFSSRRVVVREVRPEAPCRRRRSHPIRRTTSQRSSCFCRPSRLTK